jgi:hypothetical protein
MFDEETQRLLVFNSTIKPNHKLILVALSYSSNIHTSEISTNLKMTNSTFLNLIQELIQTKLITVASKEIVFGYNNQEVRIQWPDCNLGLMRKPRINDSITKARAKLEQMRLVGFVGEDSLVVKASRVYDNLMLKYTGKSTYSVPPNYFRALKSNNWVHFKRLQHLLADRQFPTLQYLEAQFKTMQTNGKGGKVYPYPAMLYSNWAINNYLSNVQENIAKQTDKTQFADETEIIKEVMQSSQGIVKQIMAANLGISELQAILVSHDSLAPIYLATHPDYLKHINRYEQEIPADVIRVLQRFSKDSKFKATIQKVKLELRCQ